MARSRSASALIHSQPLLLRCCCVDQRGRTRLPLRLSSNMETSSPQSVRKSTAPGAGATRKTSSPDMADISESRGAPSPSAGRRAQRAAVAAANSCG